jgi:hypothetical protein
MSFASAWLGEKAIYPEFISEKPAADTGIIVVVPAYNEPEITTMLDSLAGCSVPACSTEVIVVINAPANAPVLHIEGNLKAIRNIESWKKQNKDCFFQLFYIDPVVSFEGWGVGLARKTGMDEALRRFNDLGRPDGVILCLDADCTVDANYLTSVYNELLRKKERTACSIYFEHPLSGYEYPDSFFNSILQYELHLRYYYQGLIFSGFPYAFQTTGSAMAVKAHAYMKAGGMNRKQAGEDFYFIQKLAPSEGYFYLNTTVVYPSPRSSYRVPFGTGAAMQKLIQTAEPLYMTYNFRAFRELRDTFSLIDKLHNCSDTDLPVFYNKLPDGMRMFIPAEEFYEKVSEVKSNTKGFDSFRKRFFAWFNMFRIVKYLNAVHRDFLEKIPVEKSAAELLRDRGIIVKGNVRELLDFYRKLEKGF